MCIQFGVDLHYKPPGSIAVVPVTSVSSPYEPSLTARFLAYQFLKLRPWYINNAEVCANESGTCYGSWIWGRKLARVMLGFKLVVIILCYPILDGVQCQCKGRCPPNLERPEATTAQVTQSFTLAVFVIEGPILTRNELMNVFGASDSSQLGLREQEPVLAKHESRTRHNFPITKGVLQATAKRQSEGDRSFMTRKVGRKLKMQSRR